jgi:hypothetical protein
VKSFHDSWCSDVQLDVEEWNACATSGGDVNPFLLHEFFGALESSLSASPRRGWVPCHIALREGPRDADEDSSQTNGAASSTSTSSDHAEAEAVNVDSDSASEEALERLKASAGRLLGVVPAYIKSHSYGEYVFDSSWANLYAQVCPSPLDMPSPGAQQTRFTLRVLLLFCIYFFAIWLLQVSDGLREQSPKQESTLPTM